MMSVLGPVKQVAVDSRKVESGDLFFALAGAKVDGHTFLGEVARKGACGAVVRRDYQGESFGLNLVRVDDVLQTLQKLAQEILVRRGTRVVAVTGSVGKTTTKEFIAALLSAKFRVEKSLGNANSQIGLPLSIIRAAEDAQWIVLEMGMSQKGEISRLIDIAPPAIAVITKIGWAHAAYFADGIEGIAAAKAEILAHPQTELGVVPVEALSFAPIVCSRCPKVTFGSELPAHFPVQLPFIAGHLKQDLAAAVAVARHLGISWEEIGNAARTLPRVEKRFEEIVRGGVIYINDAYNASPESMCAALLHLPLPAGKGRRIGVLGEMRELGSFSAELHARVGEAAWEQLDELVCFGTACRPLAEVFQRKGRPVALYADLEELRRHVEGLVRPGDVVLIKGSNSLGLWRLLE